MKKTKSPTYSQALSELEKIVTLIESEEVDIDSLSEKVKRATYLIKFCREKLRSTEEEVRKALAEDEGSKEEEQEVPEEHNEAEETDEEEGDITG